VLGCLFRGGCLLWGGGGGLHGCWALGGGCAGG
jgi:hypothetical protein